MHRRYAHFSAQNKKTEIFRWPSCNLGCTSHCIHFLICIKIHDQIVLSLTEKYCQNSNCLYRPFVGAVQAILLYNGGAKPLLCKGSLLCGKNRYLFPLSVESSASSCPVDAITGQLPRLTHIGKLAGPIDLPVFH